MLYFNSTNGYIKSKIAATVIASERGERGNPIENRDVATPAQIAASGTSSPQ